MTLERLTQITSVGITSGITLNNPTLTGVTTIASLDSVSVGGTITAVDGNFSGNVTAVNGTFSGNVSVAGTITYEDVTNIDSVGLITARSGIHVTGGSVGIGTEYATRKLDVEIQTASGALGSVLNSHPIAEFINLSAGAPRGLEIGAPPDGFLSPVYLKVSGTSSRFAILDESNDENFTILGNGNVGIGTDNPTTEFEVLGGGTVATFRGTGGSCFIGMQDVDDGTLGFVGVDSGHIKLQTSGSSYADKLIVDPAGRVKTPYQPCFSVYRGSNQTISHNTNTKVQWNTEVFDVGSNFDSSTNYRFTAPVAGKYLFMGHLYIYPTYQVEAFVYKNGSQYKRFSGPLGSGGNDNPNGMDFMDIVDLAVNDYVEIYALQARTGDTASVDIYGGGIKETSFVGYLIG